MRLIISNRSIFSHVFAFTIGPAPQMHDVPNGGDEVTVFTGEEAIVRKIIGQHLPYGLAPAHEAGEDFRGIAYRTEPRLP